MKRGCIDKESESLSNVVRTDLSASQKLVPGVEAHHFERFFHGFFIQQAIC